MYKHERELTDQQSIQEIIQRGKFATIALCRDNDPYLVTLSYGYDRPNQALYFHTALQGLKLEFLSHNSQVCGTIIDDRGYIMNACAHAYRSVVFWGTMQSVTDLSEKKHGMETLLHHLETHPDVVKQRSLRDDRVYQNVNILRLDIVKIRGKAGR